MASASASLSLEPSHTWGRHLRVPCSCSCPLSPPLPPSLAPGSPETGGHCDTAATLCQTARLGLAAGQQGDPRYPAAACPAVDLGTFLLDPASTSAQSQGQGPPLPNHFLSCHSTTVQHFDPSLVGRDGSGASASCWSTCAVDVRTSACLSCLSPPSRARSIARDPVSDPV